MCDAEQMQRSDAVSTIQLWASEKCVNITYMTIADYTNFAWGQWQWHETHFEWWPEDMSKANQFS